MNQALSTAPAWAATPRCVCLHLRARRRRRGRRRAQAVAVERHRAPCRRAVPVSRASHALRLDLRGIPWLRLGGGRCLGGGCAGAGGEVVRAGGRSSLLPAPNVSRPARKPQFSCQTRPTPCPSRGEHCTRWTAKIFVGPDSGVLRDQICTTYGPEVKCWRQVDFW